MFLNKNFFILENTIDKIDFSLYNKDTKEQKKKGNKKMWVLLDILVRIYLLGGASFAVWCLLVEGEKND